MKLYKIAVICILCLKSISVLALPAFPGASGSGAIAKGGRGGEAIMVTNLGDGTGAGTLRACQNASGPRTCIFRVGGTIIVNSTQRIDQPFITVAGQSAPGGGIQLNGKGISSPAFIVFNDPNIIYRYIKIRKGYHNSCRGKQAGGAICGANLIFGVGSGTHIVDHVSLAWTQDDTLAWTSDGETSTVQYTLATDPLAGHPVAWLAQGNAPSTSAAITNIDSHHNLLMNASHRMPLLRAKSVRFVNNLIYNKNLYFLHASGGVSVDVIGNKFKRGPMEGRPNDREVEAGDNLEDGLDAPGVPSIYMLGNVGPNQSNASGNQFQMTCRIASEAGGGENSPCGSAGTPLPESWRRSTPLPTTTIPIAVEPVGNLEASILSHVGASRRLDCNGGWVSNRDSFDARRIEMYQTDTGISVRPVDENVASQGGFPTIAPGTPCLDSDLDGMPNEFENRLGLDNSNRADRNGDHDNDGYTNLEEYLDGVPESGEPGEPPPPPPTSITGTGAIVETPGGRSATGQVLVKGGPLRKPFGAGTATQPEGGEPPPADGVITVGSRVVVDTPEDTEINVRDAPAGTVLGTQPDGAEGTVIDGPTVANGFNWFNINFDTGTDGWAGEPSQLVETADAP